MKKDTCVKLFLKVKGIIYFLFFLVAPIFLTINIIQFATFLNDRLNSEIIKKIISDDLFFYSAQYTLFFIIFIIFNKLLKKKSNFFKNESWVVSIEKAFMPSILAFSIGLIVLSLISMLIEILPTPLFIKNWINMPNQGFVIILESVKNEAYIKVAIFFFFIIVAGPIAEEILFRGFLQESVGRIIKIRNLDIIIVATIFALFHIQSLSNAIYSFIIGIFLSIQRKKSTKINTSIWIHCMINFTGLLSGIIYQYFQKN